MTNLSDHWIAFITGHNSFDNPSSGLEIMMKTLCGGPLNRPFPMPSSVSRSTKFCSERALSVMQADEYETRIRVELQCGVLSRVTNYPGPLHSVQVQIRDSVVPFPSEDKSLPIHEHILTVIIFKLRHCFDVRELPDLLCRSIKRDIALN